MKKVKTWIMKLDYDNTYWLFMKSENDKVIDLKINRKEFEKLKENGLPTAEQILLNTIQNT